MTSDLLTLRMLLIGASRDSAEIWQLGAGRASVPIEFFSQGPDDEVLARGSIDVVIVDAGLSEAARAGVVEVARLMRPPPLVVMASAAQGQMRPAGFDGLVPHPWQPEQARHAVESCIRARLPTRVLLVDDSSTMRSIVRKILSVSRFSLLIEEANEGVAAVQQVRSGNYGLVFLDYNMPGLNGLETLAELKRGNAGTAVVMITSSLDDGIAERAHAAGAFGFLKKPFYPADIDALLGRYYGL